MPSFQGAPCCLEITLLEASNAISSLNIGKKKVPETAVETKTLERIRLVQLTRSFSSSQFKPSMRKAHKYQKLQQ